MKKSEREKVRKRSDLQKLGYALIAEVTVVLLMAFHPLYLDPRYGYFNMTWHKTFAFLMICAAAAAAFTVCWLAFYVKSPDVTAFIRSMNLIDWALIAYLLVCCLSALLSPFWGTLFMGLPQRYDGLLSQFCYAFIYFAISRNYRFKQRDFILISVGAILVSLIGLQQFFGDDIFNLFPYDNPNNPEFASLTPYTIHFRSTLGNVDIVSTYCCVMTTLTMALYVRDDTRWRFLHLGACALSFWFMVIGGADSGMVGTLVAFVFMLLFLFDGAVRLARYVVSIASLLFVYILHKLLYDVAVWGDSPADYWLYYLVFAALLLIAAAIYFAPRVIRLKLSFKQSVVTGAASLALVVALGLTGVMIVGSRQEEGIIHEASQIMKGQMSDHFGTNRGFIWKKALSVVPDHLLLGTGPDTFYSAFLKYQAEAAEFAGETYDKAHNEYLQVLVCMGLLGLIPYVMVTLGNILRGMLHSIRKAFDNPYLIAVTVGLAGYAVQAFFNINLPITAPLLWTMLALASNFILLDKRKGKAASEQTPEPVQPPQQTRKAARKNQAARPAGNGA